MLAALLARLTAVIAVLFQLISLAGAGTLQKPIPKNTTRFELGVRLLGRYDTWCRGAAILAGLGYPEAVIPLARAWRTPIEAPHLCLADAMRTLGGGTLADRFAADPDVESRRAALTLIGLFGDDSHLARLESMVISDPASELRREAVRILKQQKRTLTWRQAVFRLLDAADTAVRAGAVDILTGDFRSEIVAALRARLARESDGGVKAKIEAALVKTAPRVLGPISPGFSNSSPSAKAP